jgi:uncharacterized protein (DUF2249 family)
MPDRSDVDRSAEDRAAAQAVKRHHAQLAAGLDQRIESLLQLVESQYLLKAEHARQDLLAYLRRELVPHARAEEEVLYPAAAARPGGGPLIEGMIGEHRTITALVDDLANAGSPVRATGAGRALAALFATHLAKENEQLLPLLVAAPDVSLADLLAGMHELLGDGEPKAHRHAAIDDAHGAEPTSRAGGCGCGDGGCGGEAAASSGRAPVLTVDGRLDVRDVPRSQRHALVLSTVAALAPGEAVVLVASHAPRPVLAEVDARFREQIETRWLQSGPEVWQVRLERVAVPA